FWVDSSPGDNAFDPNGAAADGGQCLTEGLSGPNDNSTDDVMITWTPGPPTQLDCGPDDAVNPPSGPGSGRVYICEARDSDGNIAGPGVRIDVENLGGANDPDHSDGKGAAGASNTTPDWDNFCVTGTDGRCSGTIPSAGERGTALILLWLDLPASADGRYNISGVEADGGSCDADPIPPAPDNVNGTDIVRLTWEAGSANSLTLTPDQGTEPIGN